MFRQASEQIICSKTNYRCFQNIWPDFSKYMARQVLRSEHASRRVGRQEGVNDDNVDLTTGVTKRFPRGIDGDHAGYDGIRPRHKSVG